MKCEICGIKCESGYVPFPSEYQFHTYTNEYVGIIYYCISCKKYDKIIIPKHIPEE